MLSFSSCRSTKNVPQDKFLLTNVKIKCDNKDIDKSDLYTIVAQKPNRKTVFIFKFHLGVYNLFKTEKPRKFRNKIAEVVGEPPVIYDDFDTKKTLTNMKLFLQSESFYDAKVEYSEDFKKNKKVKVIYNVISGNPYKISKINYDIDDSVINNFVMLDTVNRLINPNNNLNTDVLQKERERILKLLKSNGYYYFSINDIHYYVDSSLNSYQVDLQLSIKNKNLDTLPDNGFVSQTIKNVYFYSNFNSQLYLQDKDKYNASLDTIIVDGYQIIYHNKLEIKPSTLLQSCYLNIDDLYNIKNVEKTQQHLSSLKVFRNINITFSQTTDTILEDNLANKYLDAHIYLTPFFKQSYSLEGDVYTTSGNYGAAGSLIYNNRNLFKGAQNFYLKGILSFQTTSTTVEEKKHFLFNTFESGGEAKLKIPRLLIPFLENYSFTKNHNPYTQFGFSYNYQKRPEYTRTITNTSFGYLWTSTRSNYIFHSISPLELYFVKIYNFNEDFRQTISNSFLKFSYENQLMSVISYDFVYNSQNINKLTDFSIFYANIETSGNIPFLIYKAAKIPKVDGAYRFLDIEFSQFMKFDFDYAFHQIINSKHQLVYRTFLGVGIPYGNSKGLPFVKKYIIGGANDLRAWAMRTMGPGGFSDSESKVDQIGDMKLVLNFEYRFNMVTFPGHSQLNGALFLDAGNIWSLNSEDTRTNAVFRFGNFYKQIALGTGFGVRYDMSFFVIRLDIGIPLFNPGIVTDNWEIKSLKFNKLVLNLGINYPF